MSGRIVLVTGATGFLCSEVARQLVARGDEVHALARASSDRGVLRELDAGNEVGGSVLHWHDGDLTDRASLERAMRDVQARARELGRAWDLIHGAALISYKTRDRDAAREVNVEGTRLVLDAAAAHGVARVVHVSSVVTVAACEGDEVLDESARFNLQKCGVDYVITKRAAEEIAIDASKRLDLVVVNPGAIFGLAQRKSNTARFIRRVAQGKSPLVAPPGSISVLGVEDAAMGTILALDRGRRGERYLLVESWISSLALFKRIASILDRRGPLVAIPTYCWPALVLGARMWDRIAPIDVAPPQGLVMLGKNLRFDAAKARRELGWSPRPFDEVLRGTIESLRARGLFEQPA